MKALAAYVLVGAMLGAVWAALPDPLAYSAADERYIRDGFAQGRAVAAAAGFPEWRPWESTVLLTKGKVNYLVSPDLSVQRLSPPEVPIVANGAGRIKGQPLVILAAKPALESALGGLVGEMEMVQGGGEGALVKGLLRVGQTRRFTDAEYIGVFLHEAFHLYQLPVLERWADRLPEQPAPGELWRTVYADAENNRLQNEEGAALLAAVRAPSAEGALPEARRFLAARAERRAYWEGRLGRQQAAALLEWERLYEWSEGLARFVQIKAGSGELLTEQIGEPVDAIFARERVYRIGAGLALTLDRLAPGWQAEAAQGAALTDLLEAAVSGR